MSMIKQAIENFIYAFRDCIFLYDGESIIAISPDGETISIKESYYDIIFLDMPEQIKIVSDIFAIKSFRRITGIREYKKVEWAIDTETYDIFADVYMYDGDILYLDNELAFPAIAIAQEVGKAEYTLDALKLF